MLSAIILAGGRSSRMGRAKALLPFDGEPLIVHLVRRLSPMFGEVIVVAAPDQELPPLPVTVVRDDVAYQGPAGGIAYGLRAASGAFAFVASCDAVFVQRPLVAHLLTLKDDADVVVPRWAGRVQPLLAVYRRSILPQLEAQIATGELRASALLAEVRTRTVEEEAIRTLDPQGLSFFNMNTPRDYQDALSRWDARVGGRTEP
jgi:molybdopterin-guanine dinucleotide biosynthesis protein A